MYSVTMTYSLDLRERVVSYMNDGGSANKASSIFDVSVRTIHYWMKRKDLSPKPSFSRQRKINKAKLKQHVEEHPNLLLRERADIFGVHISSLSRSMGKMKIVKKTKDAI